MTQSNIKLLLAVAALVVAVNPATQVQAQLVAVSKPVQLTVEAGSGNETVQRYVRLADAPLAQVAGNKRTGLKMTAAEQQAYAAQLAQKQAAVASQINGLGGRTLASLTKAANAIVVELPASNAPVIASISGVVQVTAVGEYELHLTQSVPYIGAAALQGLGVDGTGIRVAVLDSGVDFMHRNLGGTGLVADYNTCYAQNAVAPSGICADYYGAGAPKVIGGYDFLGENWTGTAPNNVLQPDPNPIARAATGGHGTSVSDIIAGRSADNLHKGVAPGAKLYAFKVCSAVSTACSGVGILQGLEAAIDPNGDNDLSDAVDVINLSLGASYGQRENPSVQAANIASQFGVVVVVSAGNSANRPYITGSPSTAVSAISVAQTQMPNAVRVPLTITAPASIARTIINTNSVAWAPAFPITGTVKATAASPGSPPADDACAALPAGSLTGLVALVRRGACAVSDKVAEAAAAGAVAIIVDNNAAGDPPTFSQGAVRPVIPTMVLTQADGNLIRARLAAADTVTVVGNAPVSAAGGIVTTSSRGPTMGTSMLKPDIGAPGASISANVGTGNGTVAFGGTSGAAPMVAGSAALLLQQYPTALPHEIKARLMNSADTNVTAFGGPASPDNPLSPLSRIGGGEVRVNSARSLSTAAWDASDPRAVSLSFGATRNAGSTTYRKRVLVRNYTNVARSYSIARSFRYANDQASNGVAITVPASISVPANGNATFIVTLVVNGNNLPNWAATGVNGAGNGGNGSLLDLPEYDGFITISDATESVRVPWHILPHQAHNVVAPAAFALGGAASAPLNLTNTGGSVAGRVEAFYLTGTSPQLPPSSLAAEGDGIAVSDLRAVGVRAVSIGAGAFGIQFAANFFGEATHPNYPRQVSVFIDGDNDGTDDFEVRTIENGAFASSGQNVTFVRKVSSATFSAFFFSDADLASSNTILTIPMVATLSGTGLNLALTPGSTFRFRVQAIDNYFTGAVTDSLPAMQINLNNPRFFPTGFAHTAPIGVATPITVNRNAAGDAVSTSQTGLLLMYRDGKTGREADIVTVAP